jgi:branched-chain amino acid transport system ATP-binding protein
VTDALEVRSVTVSFGGVKALTDVSLTVAPRERVALIGPNGAGKTTLVNCIAGELSPTRGSVWLGGVDISRTSTSRRSRLGVSRSFQNLELFDSMSVFENLVTATDAETPMWNPRRRLQARRETRLRVTDMLRRFGLEHHGSSPVASLPYGIRKLVELSRALIRNPSLLLLDEPVAGLSESSRYIDVVLAAIDDLGSALLLVEHDMATVRRLCERVVVLDSGQLIAEGTYDEVSGDPRVISAYLGAPDH